MPRLPINKITSILRAMIFACAAIPAAAFAQSGPGNLNVSGALYLPSGAAITQSNVNFRLEIWDKAGTCILYSEEHLAQDLSQSKGGFALAVGKGSSPNNYLESSALFTSKLFENNGAVAGGWANCAGGANFVSGDERTIRVHYDLGAGFIAMSPDVPIAAAAYAVVAETLQGKRPADLVQVRDDVTHDLSQANVENVFTSTNYARLQQLLNPSAAIGFGSQRLTNLANPTGAQDASTKDYTDKNLAGQTVDLVDVAPGFGGGKVLTWDSTANKWVAMVPTIAGTAGGDLTGSYPNPSVANLAIGTSKLANDAVTPAKIKSAGLGPNQLVITDNLTGSTFNYAACANNEVLKFVTGTGWQCTTVASLSAVISVNGKSGTVVLNGADLGLGTASMRNIGIGTSDVPELGAGGKLDSAVVPLFAGDVTGAIGATVVTALRGRPISTTAPNANEYLMWNGTAWISSVPADTGITALTGDVSASGNGIVPATLTNGVVTTPKMFANPGVNRLVATDGSSGATLEAFDCGLTETIQWTATGWACVTPSTLIGTGFIADGGNTRGSVINIGTNDNFALNLETNNAPRLTILNDGYVGIGTTSPTGTLDVNGGTAAASTDGNSIRLAAQSAGAGGNNNGGNIILLPGTRTGTGFGGAVGIGGAPAAWIGQNGLTVAGNQLVSGYLTVGTFVSVQTGFSFNPDGDKGMFHRGADLIGFDTNGAERIRVDAAGNVGIGTTTPGRLLSVNGSINVAPGALPGSPAAGDVGSSRVDLQACKLEYSIVSPK